MLCWRHYWICGLYVLDNCIVDIWNKRSTIVSVFGSHVCGSYRGIVHIFLSFHNFIAGDLQGALYKYQGDIVATFVELEGVN